MILNKRLRDLREPNQFNGCLRKWLAKRFQNFSPSGLPSHPHKLQRQAFQKLLLNTVHAVAVFKRPQTPDALLKAAVPGKFLELEDGRKADYETHCTVGLVISFLPKRNFQKHALEHTHPHTQAQIKMMLMQLRA